MLLRRGGAGGPVGRLARRLLERGLADEPDQAPVAFDDGELGGPGEGARLGEPRANAVIGADGGYAIGHHLADRDPSHGVLQARKGRGMRYLKALPYVMLLTTAWTLGEVWGYITARP